MGTVVSKQDWKAFGNLYQNITILFLQQIHTSVFSTVKSQKNHYIHHRTSCRVHTGVMLVTLELTRCTGEFLVSGRRKYHLPFSLGKIWATHASVVYIIPVLSNFISILSHYTSNSWPHCSNAYRDNRRNSSLDAKKHPSLTRSAHRTVDFRIWHFTYPERFVIHPKTRNWDIRFSRDVNVFQSFHISYVMYNKLMASHSSLESSMGEQST